MEILEVDVDHKERHVFVSVNADMEESGLVWSGIFNTMDKLGYFMAWPGEGDADAEKPLKSWSLTVEGTEARADEPDESESDEDEAHACPICGYLHEASAPGD